MRGSKLNIIGIDLGTTNSLVSYWNGEKIVVIPNALGKNLTPSVVGINEDGEVIVGEIPKERLISHPNMTASLFKRYIGSKKVFALGEKEFLPEELSSLIIASLKRDAEKYLEEEVNEAVISVPAYFSDAQRKATKRAGELAGLKVERIINEPTAAAIAYGLHQMKDETKFMVFDLGGGTFDVSILELFDNVMEVCAVSGDNFLGGEDFTNVILEMFFKKYNIDKHSIDSKVLACIKKQAELCKIKLTNSNIALMSCVVNDEKLELNITISEFEDASKPILNRLRYKIECALKDAKIKVKDLDSIILIGGATRMTIIHNFISRVLGRFPDASINPDETVVSGAGIQAGMKGRDAALKEVVLTDVCPYTLGTEIVKRNSSGGYDSGYFCPIIDRNTIIPVSRVERLYTVHDNQSSVRIKIYQGESRLISDNVYLGEMNVDIPKASAGEESIDLRYTYDINGILEVEATVDSTGIKKTIVIQESEGTMTREEIKRRLEELKHLKIHPRDKEENKLLLARGYRLYEELLGRDREVIDRYITDFENILSSQNDREIKEGAKIFKSILDQVEGEYV